MSFFIRNKTKGRGPGVSKRKLTEQKLREGKKSENALKKKKLSSSARHKSDEEILSESDIDSEDDKKTSFYESEEEEEEDVETVQEKRLRLAKEYLTKLETEERENEDSADVENAINTRLKQEALARSGGLHKNLADQVVEPDSGEVRLLRGHQLPVTCVVISPDDKYIYSGAKDCSIIKWDLKARKKMKTIPGGRKGTEESHVGHTSRVNCLAISSDGQFLVSGDENKNIMVWNPESCERLHTFTGHRGPVTGLAFRKGSHQLFSCSQDRTVKIWNLSEMAYVETLFGHQDVITGVDSLSRDRALTSGGRDCTLRVWKVVEESQLLFHGRKGSIDCLALIDEDHFISGTDDNSLALWSVMKKKPVVHLDNVHGGHRLDDGSPINPHHENWITAVAALHYSDLVASGSKDGSVRLWRCGSGCRELSPLFNIPIPGFVNSLKFSSSGEYLVAGVGQEHRLGRWWRLKEARNGVYIIPLKTKQ